VGSGGRERSGEGPDAGRADRQPQKRELEGSKVGKCWEMIGLGSREWGRGQGREGVVPGSAEGVTEELLGDQIAAVRTECSGVDVTERGRRASRAAGLLVFLSLFPTRRIRALPKRSGLAYVWLYSAKPAVS
jgi:hypothetical protein